MSALQLLPACCLLSSVLCPLSSVLCPLSSALAGTFSGTAGVGIADSTGGLSWNTTTNALTVQCWFRISVPSSVSLSDNMTILVNRRTGTTSDVHAYNLWYDIAKGTIEFSTRWGTGTAYWQGTVISTPYPDRWYHVAVVRSGGSLTVYVDGTVVPTINNLQINAGNPGNTDGVSIGSWGAAKYLYGEVQEVSIYQGVLGPNVIQTGMFQDQVTTNVNLKGYYKLGFSQNPGDRLRNLANFAPANTDGAPTGSGTISYEETDQPGEQSSFDAGRNGGAGAIAPLSGSFAWEHVVLARPTPGIPFELRIGYGSANAAGKFLPGETDPSLAGPLENRWHHSLETRVIPMTYFGDTTTLGLLMWNESIEPWDRVGNTTNY